MDKIIITDLQATGIIGVQHPERDTPQMLLINVTLEKDLRKAGISDDLIDTISYSEVSKHVLSEIATANFYLVEALAEHLAQSILRAFNAAAVAIRIEKTNFVAKTARVGVEVYRRRSDLTESH